MYKIIISFNKTPKISIHYYYYYNYSFLGNKYPPSSTSVSYHALKVTLDLESLATAVRSIKISKHDEMDSQALISLLNSFHFTVSLIKRIKFYKILKELSKNDFEL